VCVSSDRKFSCLYFNQIMQSSKTCQHYLLAHCIAWHIVWLNQNFVKLIIDLLHIMDLTLKRTCKTCCFNGQSTVATKGKLWVESYRTAFDRFSVFLHLPFKLKNYTCYLRNKNTTSASNNDSLLSPSANRILSWHLMTLAQDRMTAFDTGPASFP